MSQTPNPNRKKKSTFLRHERERALVGLWRDAEGYVQTAKGSMAAADYDLVRAKHPALLPKFESLPFLPAAGA